MDAAEKIEEGEDKKKPSAPNPRSPKRKRVLSIQSFSSSAADIESIKKQKQEPFNCDACRSSQSSDDDIVPIDGDWRSVRLCIPCDCLLQSNEICSYCFLKISSKDELFYDCIHCKRSVHFVCVAKEITGGIAAAAEIESRDFACFDCVPPAPEPSEMCNERDEISKPKRFFTCTKCRREIYFRDVVKSPKDALQLDEKSFICSDCDPEPIPANSSSDKEKGISIQKEEEKTGPRYKLRSREKVKASPITSSRAKVEPRRSLDKKKAVEVPISASAVPLPNCLFSLTDCHVCGHETKKLQVLKSDWRMVLVCGMCLVSLGTDRICAYCFDPTSEKKDDYTNCQKCLRAVHFGCIRNHPVYINRAQLNADTYTCFDCEAIPNLWKNYSAAVVAAAASRSSGEDNAAAAAAGSSGEVNAAAAAGSSGEVNAAVAAGSSGEVNAEEAEAQNLLADTVETQPDPLAPDEQQSHSMTEKHPDP